jgi:hypothetical protein
MGYTKRQFVEAAFEELGLASYVFDLTPDELQSAVRRLDAMVAQWYAKAIQIGYPLTNSPDNADLDTQTNVPLTANEAVILNLAMRIAPQYGKSPSPDTKTGAIAGYQTLLMQSANVLQQQYPSQMPAGAGNKDVDWPFLPVPSLGPIEQQPNGQLLFL